MMLYKCLCLLFSHGVRTRACLQCFDTASQPSGRASVL